MVALNASHVLIFHLRICNISKTYQIIFLIHKNGQYILCEALLTGRISNVCSVPLFSVIVSESTVAAGESVEAVVRIKTTINKILRKFKFP